MQNVNAFASHIYCYASVSCRGNCIKFLVRCLDRDNVSGIATDSVHTHRMNAMLNAHFVEKCKKNRKEESNERKKGLKWQRNWKKNIFPNCWKINNFSTDTCSSFLLANTFTKMELVHKLAGGCYFLRIVFAWHLCSGVCAEQYRFSMVHLSDAVREKRIMQKNSNRF